MITCFFQVALRPAKCLMSSDHMIIEFSVPSNCYQEWHGAGEDWLLALVPVYSKFQYSGSGAGHDDGCGVQHLQHDLPTSRHLGQLSFLGPLGD
ncbi:hypothetical protein IFM58399_10310 [Aspergillus lentulus]|uniref:Uncharacterized protein n=1 Tax=Aspergillus lentulus TaxID=293939 RepID=A0ABQ1B5J6_ASPLE|nr:uncharacterized protein IFM58399_10310 [Aspergillus lentulus]GFF56418.1 hypothetical protein IFM58399_10310 [Aspergillus lentulus]GFF94188.1 hypothetical protein IFM60648_10331 [Aspergillus lentulus]